MNFKNANMVGKKTFWSHWTLRSN